MFLRPISWVVVWCVAGACATGRPKLIATDVNESAAVRSSQIARSDGSSCPPVDPDHTLKLFRNYYKVAGVGEYLRHYAASYADVETHSMLYSTASDGDELISHYVGWGFPSVKEDRFDPGDPTVDAIRADITRRGGKQAKVQFLGTYRVVQVHELVPRVDLDGALRVSTALLGLRADEELTRISGVASTLVIPPHRACDPADSGLPAYWFDGPSNPCGTLRLTEVWASSGDVSPQTREAFERAVLAAAGRLLAGAPPSPLEELSTHRSETLLPDGVDDTVAVHLKLQRDDPATKRRRWPIFDRGAFRMSLGQALEGGTHRREAFNTVGGPLTLSATMTATPVDGMPESGASALDVTVAFEVTGADRPMSGRWRRRLPVFLDGPRVVPLRHPLTDRSYRPPLTPFAKQVAENTDMLFVTVGLSE